MCLLVRGSATSGAWMKRPDPCVSQSVASECGWLTRFHPPHITWKTPMTARFPGRALAASAGLLLVAACSGMPTSTGAELKLTGDQEVPPVSTAASGRGTFKVADDGSISGSVATTGMDGMMAHIHIAGSGKNGPVIVPLVKTSDGVWSVPPGAKLTADQLKAYQAGDLYVNVHTAANKGGEIRAQLKP